MLPVPARALARLPWQAVGPVPVWRSELAQPTARALALGLAPASVRALVQVLVLAQALGPGQGLAVAPARV